MDQTTLIGVLTSMLAIFSSVVALVVYLVKANSKERKENTDKYISFLSNENERAANTNSRLTEALDKMGDSMQSLADTSAKTAELIEMKTQVLQDQHSVLKDLAASVKAANSKQVPQRKQ